MILCPPCLFEKERQGVLFIVQQSGRAVRKFRLRWDRRRWDRRRWDRRRWDRRRLYRRRWGRRRWDRRRLYRRKWGRRSEKLKANVKAAPAIQSIDRRFISSST